jgi:signal transduction histidine kinase
MENEHVNIRVADTGAGISEENLKRIFEPFFTTRRKSGGSGLGLSITYGLARKLGGDISVVSEDGAGTSFTVTLPLEIEEEV